jgi:hypothetical protein
MNTSNQLCLGNVAQSSRLANGVFHVDADTGDVSCDGDLAIGTDLTLGGAFNWQVSAAGIGPALLPQHTNTGTPADGDIPFYMTARGNSDTGSVTYGSIYFKARDVSDSPNHLGEINFQVADGTFAQPVSVFGLIGDGGNSSASLEAGVRLEFDADIDTNFGSTNTHGDSYIVYNTTTDNLDTYSSGVLVQQISTSGMNALALAYNGQDTDARYHASGVGVPTATETLTNKDLTSETNKLRHSKAITVETPANGDRIAMFMNERAITVLGVSFASVGGTSVLFNIEFAASIASGTVVHTDTCATSTPEWDVTPSGDATIPTDQITLLEITTVTGGVTQLTVTIYYTED